MRLPVIHVVMDTNSESGGPTDAELIAEIYSRASGMRAICAAYTNRGSIPALDDIPDGEMTYSGDVTLFVEKSSDRYLRRIVASINDVNIINAWTYTGYGNYEADFAIVYTDRQNNVYGYRVGISSTGLYILSDTSPGYESINGAVLASSVVPGLSLFSRAEVPSVLTGVNISNYLQDSYPDPYSPGGTSGPDMGDGTFDFSSQPVDFQSAPTIGAYDTGMVSMYVPSAADLRSLAAYLWSGPFDPQNFRKLVADPMDAIIGLSILPLTAAEIGTLSAELMVGNISTGLTMPLATRQYVVVDCGTVNVLPKWGAYLDFSPYSKLQLFLPYIGYVDISPDDCMNGTISVRYTVDLLSGTCVVQVKCQDHVLYEFAGTCSCSCPVTAGQYQNVVTSALKLGGALMSSVTSLGGMLGALDDVANTAVSAAKPAISRSGSFGGSSGLMGHQVPYLILTVPRMCTPEDQNVMMGYPSFVTEVLGDLSGYCVVDTIHLSGIPGASTADLEEIDQLLKGGVYL